MCVDALHGCLGTLPNLDTHPILSTHPPPPPHRLAGWLAWLPGHAAAAWVSEGREVCEGIEHEDAAPVDAGEKGVALRAASLYFADQAAAAEAGRRHKGGR